MRVFLDANILFSAALPASRMCGFIQIIMEHGDCVTNFYAAEEARRNLSSKYPKSLNRLDNLLGQCQSIDAIATDLNVKVASKDVPILGGAVAGRATHLLTGDKRDFGRLWGKSVQGVLVVSPQMLAVAMAQKGILKKKT